MGYYMRYIVTSGAVISLKVIEDALKGVDARYAIVPDDIEPLIGTLKLGEYVCGEIEINTPDDDIFAEEIDDLRELIADSEQASEAKIRETLDTAKVIIAMNAVWEGGDSSVTLDKLEPLWDWLFEHFPGVLQADHEGFYDREDLIFETNLKI
ncbi:MAG: hypothetical protein RLP44_30440 [Aggregatilineales bacterium]